MLDLLLRCITYVRSCDQACMVCRKTRTDMEALPPISQRFLSVRNGPGSHRARNAPQLCLTAAMLINNAYAQTRWAQARLQASNMLTDHIIIDPKLERCFRSSDPKVVVLLTGVYFSGLLIVLAIAKMLHHVLNIPELGYFWALVQSLCN